MLFVRLLFEEEERKIPLLEFEVPVFEVRLLLEEEERRLPLLELEVRVLCVGWL